MTHGVRQCINMDHPAYYNSILKVYTANINSYVLRFYKVSTGFYKGILILNDNSVIRLVGTRNNIEKIVNEMDMLVECDIVDFNKESVFTGVYTEEYNENIDNTHIQIFIPSCDCMD